MKRTLMLVLALIAVGCAPEPRDVEILPMARELWVYAIAAVGITLMFYVFLEGKKALNRNPWASYLVSMGIAGTFVGIVVSLFGFDFDANSTVPDISQLVAGMRIAFISSALGVLGSLYLRWGLVQGADGEFENRKSGADLYDELKAIRVELREFTENLRKSSSQAFLEAMKDATSDFNTKISDQFGENFKDFNKGIGNILDWQKEHRKELDEMMSAFREIEKTFKDSSAMMKELAGHAESFGKSAETLRNASKQQAQWLEKYLGSLAELDKRLEALDKRVGAFAELAETAKSAFPIIKSNLEEITGGLRDTNQEINQGIKRTVRDSFAAMESTIEGLEGGVQKTRDQLESAVGELGTELVGIVSNIKPVMEGSMGALQGGINKTSAQILTLTQKLEQEVGELVENLQQHLLGASESHRKSLDQSVENLRGMLEEELTRSLQSLGNQLATLSHQFVDDYGPLTEKLREVVELARSMTDREPEEEGSEKESSDEGV